VRAIYVDKDIPRAILVKVLKPVWPGVVFSPLSISRYEDIPEPELPGPRWVRVQNMQCGICASDLSLLCVDAEPSIAPAALPGHQRLYLGHEALGVVTKVGPEVTRMMVGDRVIMDTRFQGATCLSQEIDPLCHHCAQGNYTRCENASMGIGPRGVGGGWGDGFTAHETEVYSVPDDLTDDQAMMIEPISTGLRAALSRTPRSGERALILGIGIVGLNTLQCLRAVSSESHITVIARHSHQAEVARRLGADEVVMDEDGYQATARITGAKLYEGMFGNRMLLGGFNVVYDCVGTAKSLQDSLRWTQAGGVVVLVGTKLKTLKLDLTPIWYQEVELIGLLAHGTEPWGGQTWRTYDLVIELMRQGKITVDGLITHRFPLSQWRQAINTAIDKRNGTIKVIFDYTLEGEGQNEVSGTT
jgi:threonine dehydrogenase-like Zn-dependent dehydrogenase